MVYTDAGVSFPNGFQKDAIQNSVGARKTNKWKNWKCEISVQKTNAGTFLVIEDSGTVGLTGNNTPAEEVDKMMAEGTVLPPTERLSRFTSMFNSGGNTNANDKTFPKIVDVASLVGEIEPFGDIVTPRIEKIEFLQSVYEQYLDAGILKLRARLIANESDEQFEKGDKITSYFCKIYLNTDEKNGKNDAFNIKSIFAPENPKRSWHVPGQDRTIFLNNGHAAYINVADYPELQHEYLRERMLHEYVLMYLTEGKYDMFGQEGQDFAECEPQEAVDAVMSKIEEVYYKSLN